MCTVPNEPDRARARTNIVRPPFQVGPAVTPSTTSESQRCSAEREIAGFDFGAAEHSVSSALVDVEMVAVAMLAVRYVSNARTRHKVISEVRRFFRFATESGVHELDDVTPTLAEVFCWSAVRSGGAFADVSAKTAANRQSFLRTTFGLLGDAGLPISASIAGRPIVRRGGDMSIALTSVEMEQVRVHAGDVFGCGRRTVLVALAEAGGDSAEIAAVTASDIDLTSGTVRFTGSAARTCRLTIWGTNAIASFIHNNPLAEGQRLCVEATTSPYRAADSVRVRLASIVADARLASAHTVTGRSIRLGAARQILDTDGLESAARLLGNQSLDATARALGYCWWDQA